MPQKSFCVGRASRLGAWAPVGQAGRPSYGRFQIFSVEQLRGLDISPEKVKVSSIACQRQDKALAWMRPGDVVDTIIVYSQGESGYENFNALFHISLSAQSGRHSSKDV